MSEIMNRPANMVDVYRLLPEGTPIQVINNRFYINPSPTFDHFSVSKKIWIEMDKHTELYQLGITVFAPFDVFLGDKNAVQPDVFFISAENNHMIKKDGVYGAPDLVVEILSSHNKNTDLFKKKSLYEQFGVKEYFIADPSDKSVITYYLKEGKYIEQKKQKGKLVSKLLKKSFVF